MRLYIKFITLAVSLFLFGFGLFAIANIASDQVFIETTNKILAPASFVNSMAGFYCAVMIVTFVTTVLSLMLVRKDMVENTDLIAKDGFKFINYLAMWVPVIAFLVGLVIFMSYLLQTGVVTMSVVVKIAALTMISGSTILFLKTVTTNKKVFITNMTVILVFYLLTALGLSLFTFTKIGPPWISRYINEDASKTSELRLIIFDIYEYASKNSNLPKDLKNLENASNYKDLASFSYNLTGKDTYKICTNFKVAALEMDFPHEAGNACFDQTVFLPTPSPVYTPAPVIPLSCKTLYGKMVKDQGFGYIGCDMEVTNGQIDLARSYCEGQTTHIREYLVPDAFGRKDRYWTTLQTPDVNEEVKVFAYSISGNKVECLPSLNR